jgi:hypothetical protein
MFVEAFRRGSFGLAEGYVNEEVNGNVSLHAFR